MAMILDAFMKKCCTLLTDFLHDEVVMLLGVKDELEKLLRRMKSIRFLLKDAEKRKLEESSIDLWLSELKDFMYDADDIIDRCMIEGDQLLADGSPKNKTSPVCCNFSSAFPSCFTGVPLRHEIGKSIKELNDRLNLIYENRKEFKLEKSEILETQQITLVNRRLTDSLAEPLVVGGEVEAATNKLVNLLTAVKSEKKCRLFAVTGMGGIGKTTLAKKIFNHPKVQTYFSLVLWVCISQTYSETELLKHVIRGAKGSYGEANTKAELQLILKDSLVSGQNFFLVLDDVWRADVWVELLSTPLHSTNTSVLVTTRYEDVAKDMKAACIHNVMTLSVESSWDMLCRLLFSEEEKEEQQANDWQELGINIVKKCGCLPLAIKAIAGVLNKKERTSREWQKILMSDVWSIRSLHEYHVAALYLSFEDLPSHLKQCFLYFCLYPEDANLYSYDFIQLWVAEGFVEKQQDSMEDLVNEYLNELLNRNLLLPSGDYNFGEVFKMHDLIRSLTLYLSKEEASYGDANVKNSSTSTKLRRLSLIGKETVKEILDSVANPRALRTLLVGGSDLILDDVTLRRFSFLRVLDISNTKIKTLPHSIGNLVHLRYLNLNKTDIKEIPESIEYLSFLRFLNIYYCTELRHLPNGITKLHNLRCFNMGGTPISFIPKGIRNMKHVDELIGFVQTNNDSTCSKLEDLSSIKQLRRLEICLSINVQNGANIFKDLSNLSYLNIKFQYDLSKTNMDGQLAVEKLLDGLIPPQSLEELTIDGFIGRRYPNWMALASFENYVPNLTKLSLRSISCTQLPPLGHLLNLRHLVILNVPEVKKIGPEFLGGGVDSTKTAFPKLETLCIGWMNVLEDWTFGSQVEKDASSRIKSFPCLQKLNIPHCRFLKQVPEGFKHSAMKSLSLNSNRSLISLDDLPVAMEEVEIISCDALEKVCCLPMLKVLRVDNCAALACVGKLDALQKLVYSDWIKESLPEWLLMLLKQLVLQNDAYATFLLELECSKEVLQACVEGGSYWNLIQHIPRVFASSFRGGLFYLRYNKQPLVYNTNL